MKMYFQQLHDIVKAQLWLNVLFNSDLILGAESTRAESNCNHSGPRSFLLEFGT